MTNQPASETYQKFAATFFAALGRAVTEASGTPWQVGAPDTEPPAGDAEPLRIRLTLDGSLQGQVLLEFPREQAAKLAAKLLGEEPGEATDELSSDQSDALIKAIQAAGKEFCVALSQAHGSFTSEAAEATDFAGELPADMVNVAQVKLADEDANSATVVMYLEGVLAQSVSADGQSFNSQVSATDAAGAMLPPVNLKLVMDVELNVTLRFGKRQLTLREVLDLTSGSVIELDRLVDEPVELLLDGEVIARGEAVVIDGNYGLRVTEVPQPISCEVLR